jgi:hypothetical protein
VDQLALHMVDGLLEQLELLLSKSRQLLHPLLPMEPKLKDCERQANSFAACWCYRQRVLAKPGVWDLVFGVVYGPFLLLRLL